MRRQRCQIAVRNEDGLVMGFSSIVMLLYPKDATKVADQRKLSSMVEFAPTQ